MNRRSFITQLLAAGVGSLILPGAGRRWKRSTEQLWIPNPAWVNAEYECILVSERDLTEYKFGPVPNQDDLAYKVETFRWTFSQRSGNFVPVEDFHFMGKKFV